jgi:hypothetical protein
MKVIADCSNGEIHIFNDPPHVYISTDKTLNIVDNTGTMHLFKDGDLTMEALMRYLSSKLGTADWFMFKGLTYEGCTACSINDLQQKKLGGE